jgi:WD40 repeat protein
MSSYILPRPHCLPLTLRFPNAVMASNANCRIMQAHFDEGEMVTKFALWVAVAVLIGASNAHTPTVPMNTLTALTWSHDGNDVLAANADGQVVVYDANNHRERYSIPAHSSTIDAILPDPNTSVFATFGNGIARTWEFEDGKLIQTLVDEGGYIYASSWSSKGDHLFTATVKSERADLLIWDPITGKQIDRKSTGLVLALGWNQERSLIALGGISWITISKGDELKIVTELQRTEMTGLGYDIRSLAWSSDSKLIASGSINGTIRIWDIASGKILVDVRGSDSPIKEGPESIIQNLTFDANDSELISVRGDGTIRVWNVETGTVIDGQFVEGGISAAAVSPYKGRIAFGAKTLEISPLFPTLQRVKNISPVCLSNTESPSAELAELLSQEAMDALTLEALPEFIEQVKALPEDAVPEACAADLIAVAEALIAAP